MTCWQRGFEPRRALYAAQWKAGTVPSVVGEDRSEPVNAAGSAYRTRSIDLWTRSHVGTYLGPLGTPETALNLAQRRISISL